ncbi:MULTISPECIES: DUF1128 domain-containing protein [Bacillaceae]|jgi:uncharacterized protein YfkK (UPF0435 family)|uniref:UPF0435 protein BT1A1_0815 n=2 Tax=Bacillaceae TaxID=186817 RepID=A0A090IYN3_9BACI|nr:MULTISPECIES: DUF1128 domain-containing protein [Bacillaceae]NWN97595.1 DUF1128 domain-containing protein [Bacillus sp. (in: firmicutes)]KIO67148.1 hypothetical protein B4064_1083 [Caldibacillus thermoamylovorans]KIO68770.1 hypothetical protein B4065_1329 [Caldibacillus thermoamylovorans]MBU5343486.1 DUF1128 domain-containing protein [Caldifermentibacillus hisashii]MCM3055839.1 DUF1128 domain-containing protein [Caldibacillus thermoamylovorans]
MDLSVKSKENMVYMVDKISEKLNFINTGIMKASQFDEEKYEELFDIYQLVIKRDRFSPNERQAIAEELGSLRKK